MKVAVVGAGSWGTTVAALGATNAETVLWARDEELARRIEETRENGRYLPGILLPEQLRVTASLREACRGAEAVALAVPSHGMREVLSAARLFVDDDAPVVSLSKGVERDSLLRMTQVAGEVLVDHRRDRIGVLTGPNLAREVAEGQPAASVVAIGDVLSARTLQAVFMTPTFRVYTNPDVVGCEIAGACKNVMALGAGMASGLGYGDNTLAALVTRGLAELARLGLALGGEPLTFSGLAGMGDLVATCTSTQSRNRTVGFELARGRALDDIVREMDMVAEGVKSTQAVLAVGDAIGSRCPSRSRSAWSSTRAAPRARSSTPSCGARRSRSSAASDDRRSAARRHPRLPCPRPGRRAGRRRPPRRSRLGGVVDRRRRPLVRRRAGGRRAVRTSRSRAGARDRDEDHRR